MLNVLHKGEEEDKPNFTGSFYSKPW
ncbi:BnaC03g69690D [Brassica napus]|uniref:BnaC03g69690D protein n=1 Tax=Brassica napus TaxID=3708 RepID=A0A078GK00_BRANA|nr:BnaC03g69690D [Brassica napus]